MSNSLKIKYVFGALEIAKRNREGRELEIIKSANRMVEQLENELADKEKQLAEARAEIERKDKLIEQMRGALTKLIGTLEVMSVMPETLGKCPVLAIDAPELEQARAALAAERGEGWLITPTNARLL